MYVYFGHIGREGIEVVAGTSHTPSIGGRIMAAVGLLATIGVTVYLTRLARSAIQKETAILDESNPSGMTPGVRRGHASAPSPMRGTLVTVTLAMLMLVTAAFAYLNRQKFQGWFGPPSVELREAYKNHPEGPRFDDAILDELLHQHVDEHGWVDYERLRQDLGKLDQYIDAVSKAPFDDMGRDQKLALLINAYNAFTLRLILEHENIGSIKEIPASQRWNAVRWQVGPYTWSLGQIEHEQIRPKFKEPRIHFALVCAASDCPKLRNEAYVAERIDEQLEDQTLYVHQHGRWFQFESRSGVVNLTALYQWYATDFEQVAGSALNFAARYVPALRARLDSGEPLLVKWIDYDWRLNSQNNRPKLQVQ